MDDITVLPVHECELHHEVVTGKVGCRLPFLQPIATKIGIQDLAGEMAWESGVCLCGEGHVDVDSLAVQQLVAAHESRHFQLHAEGVAVVDEAREDVLVQVVLQLLKHALDAASDGLACCASLHL